MIKPIIRLLSIAALIAPSSAFADTEQARVQFCWAMGKFDHTIYYAEIENREDREASFDDLLEISGIDHDAVKCSTSDSATHRLARVKLMKDWLESEFEIVNTTFLSDLDY
jgi:predicted DNA-binding protein with PD1-like motif